MQMGEVVVESEATGQHGVKPRTSVCVCVRKRERASEDHIS